MQKIGIIVCEDADSWGGEAGIGSFLQTRFSDNSDSSTICFELIHAVTGTLPNDDEIPSFHGFIISGSHYSVNDNLPWIQRLEEFIRYLMYATNEPKPKLFGICFGHQLIAKALGGQVTKNATDKFKFGGETVHAGDKLTHKEFYKCVFGDRKTIKIMQSHGEEVSVIPKVASPLGESLTCFYEVLCYGDNILSTQGHPELLEDKMKEIIMPRLMENGRLSEEEMQGTLHSFSNVDTDTMTRFVISFLTQS